jgi:uroporphyrinogen III methyltransferase / synthase
MERINPSAEAAARRGTVYLVGAGPGDPGLLTVRARDLLASCEVVVYDHLINPEILLIAPAKAEQIYAGKIGCGQQTAQEEINRLLVARARLGRRVVRLKGGDPFLFGRGSEEAAALREAGLPFEVVPGVSSALAAPAYAGIPLTHRGLAASVAILTGAHVGGRFDTRALAALSSADTLVILMGMSRLGEIAAQLAAAGRGPETPAAAVHWGTYEQQQTIVATLGTIAAEAERAGLRAPGVIIVGAVVTLREELSWFAESAAAQMTLAP